MTFKHGMHLLFVAIVLIAQALKCYANPKPNFIFVLTDDQSYGYLGVTGNKIVKTPNVDAMANDGILFSNAHISSAICTPSRISILLSQYERKHGVNFNSGTSVSEDAWKQSYPVLMREAGYYTGWIGKNHSPIGKGGYQSGVMEQGFDYWYAGHGHIKFYPKEIHPIFKDAKNDTQLEIVGEGVDDFLDNNESRINNAIRFIEDRPHDKPFMLSVNLNLPHGSSIRTMEQRSSDDALYRTAYRDIDIPLPKYYVAKDDIKTPKLPEAIHRAGDRQTSYNYVDAADSTKEFYLKQMQAMTGIDRMIGNMREKLEELNLAQNTVIVFTSDHGLFIGEHGLGGKALCYEKTTHVPLIVFDPRLKKKYRGQQRNDLVQSIDVAPTMLAMAGINAPTSFQGEDISHLFSQPQKTVKRKYVFSENLWSTIYGNPRCDAIQTNEWKYIRYYKNQTFSATTRIKVATELGLDMNAMLYGVHDTDIATYREYVEAPIQGEKPVYEELFNLSNDPDELANLAGSKEHAHILYEMRLGVVDVLKFARGTGKPKVERFTADSKLESGKQATTY